MLLMTPLSLPPLCVQVFWLIHGVLDVTMLFTDDEPVALLRV